MDCQKIHGSVFFTQTFVYFKENVTTNLGYKFIAIYFSETWTSQTKSEPIKYGTIPGHHLHHGVKGNTLSGGCSFYIREGIKNKARNDLDISYCK